MHLAAVECIVNASANGADICLPRDWIEKNAEATLLMSLVVSLASLPLTSVGSNGTECKGSNDGGICRYGQG
jgi:hypothetical protein